MGDKIKIQYIWINGVRLYKFYLDEEEYDIEEDF